MEEQETLRKWNVAAFLLHFTSFLAAVVMSIVYRETSYVATITNDFTTHVATYQLIWVDLPFPAITACFHFAIAYSKQAQKLYFYPRSASILRWVEYSITASLMTWAILQLAGVTNVFLLVLAGPICNIALQLQGYLQERFRGYTRVPTIVGWLIFASQWTLIWTSFGYLDNPPWFIYSIVIGCFCWFVIFGLVQLLDFSRTTQEYLYIGLSFTSKLYLTWNLLIAAATT